jgi:hypothetical protein
MKRDIPAAIALKHLNRTPRQLLRRSQHILRLGIPAQGDHRSMLQQQQHVSDAPFFPQRHKSLLQPQSGRIIKDPELNNGNHVPT